MGAERVVIESASTYELASEALAQFQSFLADAHREQRALDLEISALSPEAASKKAKFESWNNGFLLKNVLKKTFQRLAAESEEASARLSELQEQRQLAKVATVIEVSADQKHPFGRLCDAFSRLAESQRIWDTLSTQRTNQFRERTIAASRIERQLVRFQLGGSALLSCIWRVPHLTNANGGDMFVYPGFVLYQVSRESFTIIDSREVVLSFSVSRFIEEEGVPREPLHKSGRCCSDSEVVGQTWTKANKDGSPDRRFANNHQIPIAKYAELALTTKAGLNERYMVSNYVAAEQLAGAWRAYLSGFEAQA